MVRYVLYGGKGGVGKTTVAAATGLRLARDGRETLVVSTDPAHSLGDALGTDLDGESTDLDGEPTDLDGEPTDLDGEPTAVRDHLWAEEVDPETGRETYETIVAALADELRGVGVRVEPADVEALFAAGAVPGSDEVATVERFVEYADDDRWETVVFDTAPTGHTLRLLELPAVLEAAVEQAGSLRSQVRRLADAGRAAVYGPMAYAFGGQRGSGSGERDEFEAVRERMARARDLLRDPAVTEFRVVTLPEAMAVSETERLVERLRAFEVPVGTLVVNRVVGDVDADCDRCRRQRESQQRHLAELRRLFPDLDVQVVPEVGPEVTGLEELERVADVVAA